MKLGQVDKNDIPMQKQSCREFANHQQGWVIQKEFQEKGISGYKISAEDKFTPDILSMAIENTKAKLNDNINYLAEKRHQLNCKEEEMGKIDYHYERFMSWADEFEAASPERKKMIICTLFKEINVGRGYEIEILMDSSYEQFVA